MSPRGHCLGCHRLSQVVSALAFFPPPHAGQSSSVKLKNSYSACVGAVASAWLTVWNLVLKG